MHVVQLPKEPVVVSSDAKKSDSEDVKELSLEERQRRRLEAIDARVDILTKAADGDIARAERMAAGTIILGSATGPMLVGVFLVLASLILPHSGDVRGFDVLLFTDRASDFLTTVPERIFVWLAFIGGFLLTVATMASRSTLVAWITWAISGVGSFYCVLAIGMRNTRGPNEPGAGPSIGLFLSGLGLLLIVIALSTRLFRRTAVQAEINARRRIAADKDEASQAAQQVLRVGHVPEAETVLADDRRKKVAQRRRSRTSDRPEAPEKSAAKAEESKGPESSN